MTAVTSERPHTPEDFDELYDRVWEGYTSGTPTDPPDDHSRTNDGVDLSPKPPHISDPRIPRPSSTTPNRSSQRIRRPLPPTPGYPSRPHSQGHLPNADRGLPWPVLPTQISHTPIAEVVPTSISTSRHNVANSETHSLHSLPLPEPEQPDQPDQPEIDLEDSSSLYPGYHTPYLPKYEPPDHRLPDYCEDSTRLPPLINGDPGHSSFPDFGPHPSFVSGEGYSERSERREDYDTPYGGQSQPSTSDLSYVEQGEGYQVQQIISNIPDSPFLNHPISPFTNPDHDLVASYETMNSDHYLESWDPNYPGPSNIARRPTELLREIMLGNQQRNLELHDNEDEWDMFDEEPDRFVNFSLLSHLAVQLRDKVPRGEHVKSNVPYPRAFTGKDIVSTIHTQISRELVENHGGVPNDRRAALQIARSLQSQLMFVEVEWGGRILQDGVEDVYQFLDEEEVGVKEELPTSVVTILARCYSPSCGEGPQCYAYGCPRKGDSLSKMLPKSMETPSTATKESWPRTVPPEVLKTLPEREITRQIIIHKLISKEEQYVKDLDLVDSVFIQPLRQANPPVITPSDKLEEFIQSVFHNILDVRECNMRLLEFLSVRQREEAPIIKRIGDIILGIAADFRDPYPAYIGNHPLAERRMKDELESNPDFRLFIEQCSRQQSARPGASGNMRLDLRHFLNRPAEHLQKYPVLLQAICKSTERGSPDVDFLVEAIAVIKNLQGVAQLWTFQSSMGRGTTGKWGWHDLVTPDARARFSPDEAKRQSTIFEFVKGEMLYVKDLESISTMYIRPLRNSDPPIIPKERLDTFIKDVFHNFKQLRTHHRRLVNTLQQIQRDEHPTIKSITAAVLSALLDFREAYLDYIPNYPIAEYRIEEEAERNPKFKEFMESCTRHPDAHRTYMKDFLNCPFPRLLQYVEMLREILELTPRGHEDLRSIPDLIEIIESLARETEPGVVSSKQKVQLWTYNANVIFRPGESMDLDLLNESRALIYAGKLYRQPDSNPEAGGLNELFCLLFDNYLVMTKRRDQDGVSKYHVARRPIPLDLLTLLKFPDNSNQRGSGFRNHRSAASTTSASSNSGGQSENGDPQIHYPFIIHHNGRFGGRLTFYTDSAVHRAEWKQKLEEAIGLRKVVQETNKVFEIETLSAQTFTVPPVGYSLNPSTWLENNITGKVTCSIPFNTPDGRRLVAIGCSEGIWIGFRRDSSSMRRVLHLKSVTQCTMLDDFGLFLVLADKQLFAYHIEALVPPPHINSTSSLPHTPQKLSGNKEVQFFSVGKTTDRTVVIYMRKRGSDSHFHVLEPVLDRIHAGPRAATSRFFPKSPRQDWFKKHPKEFFLSCDTYDLIFMTSSIAILSRNGFEIMDLNGSSSTVIPLKDNRLTPLLQRPETCRPIGIFRTPDDGFLLCYSQFGVYVNKKGVPSRSECIVEWEGNAESVAFHAPYVLLFDPRFIEIRHVETGRLSQIVMGLEVRCVWDGRGHSSNTAGMSGTSSEDEMVQEAHVHAVLNHAEPTPQSSGRPLRPTFQHIFELIPTIPLYLPGSLSSPSTTTYFPRSDSFSPPPSPQG